jgi:hypothetical protein
VWYNKDTNEKGMISMTFSEIYSEEKKLLEEIDSEKGFTWHKLFNIMALDAFVLNHKNF